MSAERAFFHRKNVTGRGLSPVADVLKLAMAYELPALPFGKDDLAPHISAETLEYHHGKHHAAYLNKLNELTEGDSSRSLEDLIRTTDGGLFNQAAQVWNHTFYWNCMKSQGGGAPEGALADAIARDFGSFEEFVGQFKSAAMGQFGSGWAWLVKDDAGALSIVTTANAGNPMTDGLTPVMTCDVWEHAYYVDYRNARPKYLDVFFESLANWDFAGSNY